MPVTRLNHAVLYVRDVERTRDFYEQVLGFET
ncbi:MAG: VOC family protein, partial [Acidimicrobiales bacterium]